MDNHKPEENGECSTSAAMSKTTTISTIAVQSGKTRIVIALLHCGDWMQLKILEITPELTSLGNTLSEALELQKAHNEVLRQLQNKQSPVEELLRQADQLIATQKPRAEVYAAMAESLGRAWRDINSTLELRKVILDLNVQYHTRAEEFFEKSDSLESACTDTIVPVEIDAVKNFLTTIHDLRRTLLESLMGALQAGNSLLAKLKELGAEGTLDSRPERIRTSVTKAISQIQSWMDELHIKRQTIELTFNRRKTQLEQCLALAILATDLKELEDILHERRQLLANSSQLGDSSSSAELLLHEHRKLLPEAKQLQERALKITKATEQLVTSGCFAGEPATQQAYIILSSTSDYLADLQTRETLLDHVVAFFRSAQTVLNKLDQLEIQLKNTELPKTSPKLAELHAQCSRTIEEATAAPIAEGYAILEQAGFTDGTEGVKKMVQELENMKILLESLCVAHKEENVRINASLNYFLEKQDEIYKWLVQIAEAFLQGHQDMGGDLRMAEDFLQLHGQLQNDLQTKGNEINQLLLSLPPILEYLEDNQRKDVDAKVEQLHDRWMKLKNILENRLELARIYVKFHMEADIVNREMDKMETLVKNRSSVDETTMKQIEEKFESLVPFYQSAKNTGLTFINDSKRISEPHLDTQRARVCVESVLEKLSGRQLNVTKTWQSFRDEITEKRELLVRLEQTMAESTKTISWVTKLDSQLYPLITIPASKPSEISLFLENKLETVLPDIRKAQAEVQQKIQSAEALVAQTQTSDEKTISVKNKLSELNQKLLEISSEYQVLLQVLIGYFKNLEEIIKKAEILNASIEKSGYPKSTEGIESVIRDHDILRETIIERFNFAQTECQQIEERIKKQEPPQSADHDIRRLRYVLESQKSEFEKAWRQRHQTFTSLLKVSEFRNECKIIEKNVEELSSQLKNVKNQAEESFTSSKSACQTFYQFQRHIETLDIKFTKLKDDGTKLKQEVPAESQKIENEITEIGSKLDDLTTLVKSTGEDLEKTVKYFELIEKAGEWCKEGSKLLVTTARKATDVRSPAEAEVLLQEIDSFVVPGEPEQSQRIQEITSLAQHIFGPEETKYAPVISANKDMLDSFSSITNELRILSRNLKAAEEERIKLLKEQEEARKAEEARRLEEARLVEERRKAEEERLAEQARLAEERRKAEEARIAEKNRIAEEKLKAVQARLAEEARRAEERRKSEEERLAREVKLAEERRIAEEKRLADEVRRVEAAKMEVENLKAQQLKLLEEAKKMELERKIKEEEDLRRVEQARQEELAKRAEEAKLLEIERKNAEMLRVQQEEMLKSQQAQLEEEKRRLEEEKQKAELARKEEELQRQERAIEEEEKLKALFESERKKIEEQNRLEMEKLKAEQARIEEERRKADELRRKEAEILKAEHARIEDERQKAEQARVEEERRQAEELRRKKEERLKLEQAQIENERQKAEQARIEEEKRKAEELRRKEEERQKAEHDRLEKERQKAEQHRIEEERRVREEIEKQHSVQITEITEIHKIESLQREKSPMIDEPEESPVFISPLTDAVIQEGSKFTFMCHVTGHPTPHITWFKSGVPIEKNPDYHTSYVNGLCSLTIEETFAEDSAKYTCRAINSAGTAETSAVLSVKETEPEEQLTPPSFVKMLSPEIAKEKSTFQFKCKVEGNPLPTVQWFKNSDCIDNSPDYVITYNNGDAILKFDNVELADKAEYTCKASNQLGTAQSTANLIVTPLEPTEAPVFVSPLSNVMARAGQKIKLECEVVGMPQPMLTWSHNGKPVKETRELKLQSEGNKATLIILEAFPKDAGTYSVNAKNIAGEATSTSTISVKGRLPNDTSDSELASDMEPIKPSIQLPLANTSVKEGSRLRLDCVIVGQPEPEVIWYHDGRPVKESPDFQLLFQGDRCSLVIQEALPEDGGEYKVVALNSAGEASSQCILTVEPKEEDTKLEGPSGAPPKFTKLLTDVLVSEDDKVVFEGTVEGEPCPDVKWLLNNLPVSDSDHYNTSYDNTGNFKLVIEHVKPEDKGVYTVKASNSAGEAKCFAQLIVKSFKPPEHVKFEEQKMAPVFKEMFNDRSAFEETSTKFECIVTGKPAPKIRWLFNGNPISGKDFLISTSGDRQVLNIPCLKKEHQGTITCAAENEAGKASCAASLTIQPSNAIALSELSIPTMPSETKQHVETSYSVNKEVVTKSSTTSSSKIVALKSEDTEPHIEEHKTIAQESQFITQVNQLPPEIQKSEMKEEYHKVGKQLPIISQKSSTSIVGGQTSQDSITDRQHATILKPAKVTRPPKFVSPVIGKIVDQLVDVLLEGILDGQPSPTVTWTKNGEPLQESDKIKIKYEHNKASVSIKSVKVEDAGRYSCKAVNEAGSAVSTADLVVRKVIFPPVFGRRLQAQVIKLGDKIIMEVEITGSPEPTVTWYKDNVPIKDCLGNQCRLKNMGQGYTLAIDKAKLSHSGRYMVRATNAGGEAQSIADIAVYEPTPDTMMEVVKTVVFEDVKKHETLASTANKTSSTVTTTIQPVKTETMAPACEILQSYKTQSECSSKMEQQSSQKAQTIKLEHTVPDIPLPKPIQKHHIIDKQTDYEILGPESQKQSMEEKKIEIQEGGIETSSISKESSLQFFVKKIKGEDSVVTKKESMVPEPIKPEILKPFLTSEIETPIKIDVQHSTTPHTEYKSYTEHKTTGPVTQQFMSSLTQREIIKEFKPELREHIKPIASAKPITQEYSSFSSVQRSSEPQEFSSSTEIKKEFKTEHSKQTSENKFHISKELNHAVPRKPYTHECSSFSSVHHAPEPQQLSSYSFDVTKEFILKPEPPAEICFSPKPESTTKIHQVSERIRQISENQKELPAFEVPQGGVKVFPSSKSDIQEKREFSQSFQSSSHQTSSSSYFEKSETKTPDIWSTRHELVERPTSVASSSYSTERHSYSRPLSSMSEGPSQDAIQMEKQWAHKFSEVYEDKSWPPQNTEAPRVHPPWPTQTTLERKWAPVSEVRVEKTTQESKDFLDKTPVLVPHYIGEVTRLETTVKDQNVESFSSTKSEVFQEKQTRPSEIIKSWPPAQEYQSSKGYSSIDSLSIRPVSVQDITDEVYLEPGPPPEIGYAAPPKERRRSHVGMIEQDLEKDLQREPSKILPCAVRTMPPPPLPPKKEIPQAPPIPARPTKEKPRKKVLPYVPFEKFPDLEPFPFKPDPEKPRAPRVGPPPTPSKFVKGKFTDSDYESDFENVRIPPKWKPSVSDTEEPRYRRVRPPSALSFGRSQSLEPEPLPPSKFDHPPQFQGPPRPEINFEAARRKKDSAQIKKMTKQFEARRSPPMIKPASPPVYVIPDKKPDSPKQKNKIAMDGYTADTDEPFQQKTIRSEYMKEERTESRKIMESSHKSYEMTAQKYVSPKPRTVKYPAKKKQYAPSTTFKELVATPIVTNQTSEHFIEHIEKDSHIEQTQLKKAKYPPPPSPSKFVRGEFRESDYESDYEGKIPPVWGSDTEHQYKPVRPLLTPTSQRRQLGRTPTPPTEFEQPPLLDGPPRPKFEPIEKITPVPKPVVCKPKPLSAGSYTDMIVATPALPQRTVYIEPGPPPEMGYSPGPKKTQYYKSTVSAPYQNAVQTETSNVVHMDESTETCHRTMSVQQTHKVIRFGDQYNKKERKIEELPFSPTPRRSTSVPPPPTPSKFTPGEFRESDYESEVESTKIRATWEPTGRGTGDLHYKKVKAPTPSRSYDMNSYVSSQKVLAPSEFEPSKSSMSKTVTDGNTRSYQTSSNKRFYETSSNQVMNRSQCYEPPAKFRPMGQQQITKSQATKMASKHMDSMTKEFKSKTQQFVHDIMHDVAAKDSPAKLNKESDAQVYREESRAMTHGTKHVDPDTGLIYFKYDFGYEFGIILPGESKSGGIPVPTKTVLEPPKRSSDITMPVYHETTKPSQETNQAPTPQFKPKKFTTKWDPTSESEMSDYEGEGVRKRQGYNSGYRWEPSSCSPVSLSPSLPSTSPAFNHSYTENGMTQTPPNCATSPNVMKILPGQARPPMFITPLRDIAVVSGQAAKFECIVQSEPPPNILWSKNGRIIENSKDYQIHYRNGVCRLTVAQAYPEDAGTYTCTATNGVGTSNTTATLQVPGERRSLYL